MVERCTCNAKVHSSILCGGTKRKFHFLLCIYTSFFFFFFSSFSHDKVFKPWLCFLLSCISGILLSSGVWLRFEFGGSNLVIHRALLLEYRWRSYLYRVPFTQSWIQLTYTDAGSIKRSRIRTPRESLLAHSQLGSLASHSRHISYLLDGRVMLMSQLPHADRADFISKQWKGHFNSVVYQKDIRANQTSTVCRYRLQNYRISCPLPLYSPREISG